MITSFTATFIVTAIVVLSYMFVAFAVASLKKNNGIADVAWGVGFIIAAFVSAATNERLTERKLLVSALVLLWGLRLSSYLWMRMHGRSEDWRYHLRREPWGRFSAIESFFQVFVVQGILLLIIALPVIYVNTYSGTGLGLLDALGLLLWSGGFFVESVADYQLFRFKRNEKNKDRILMDGLWRFSRHPNYFGEVLMWWGIFTIALSVPGGYATAFGPILLTLLLLRVSGIPVAERRFQGDPDYEQYRKRTSAFVPWFPSLDSPPSPR